jgi:hypothetical protein
MVRTIRRALNRVHAIHIATACLAGAAIIGCANKQALNLDPVKVAKSDAAIMGHITAFNRDQDETKHCYAEFQNMAGERIAYLSLDKSGWVMATLPTGPVKLAKVVCAIYGAVSQVVSHEFTDESFVAPGQDKIAYFGHVAVAFNAPKKNLFAEALTPPIIQMFIPLKKQPPSFAQIANKFDLAVTEYIQRYPEGEKQLKPVAALLSSATRSN